MRLDRNFTFTRIWDVQFIPLVAIGFHGEDLSTYHLPLVLRPQSSERSPLQVPSPAASVPHCLYREKKDAVFFMGVHR